MGEHQLLLQIHAIDNLTGLYIIKMGKGREGEKREKKKIWGKYNFWQYQMIKFDY